MKQIEVSILGHSYMLGCPEGGETSLLEAVSLVDREMSTIRDTGRVKARERIAVLAALNLAFQLVEDMSKTNLSRAVPNELAPNAEEVTALIRRIDLTLQSGEPVV